MFKPEVLAPVGNWAMLEAAVRAGADAVYLGMGNFNARRGAENFSKETFSEAVQYCHVRGVRVYLTLNTLVSDEEFEDALSAAQFAYSMGADAVIVQDLGLAAAIRETLPDFELHASTQLSVHTSSALELLSVLGFRQVVLAREMSRQEIKEFCIKAREYNIRVEVFVHGALCMSVSGQCYLSAVLGGRSGNRGLCAGPCRLPFSVNEAQGYALSLKDLSLVEHLHDLQMLGVSSFKIEGRLKRPEYVAVATAVCRKTLDGEVCDEWKDALSRVFSRNGFTDGYYTHCHGGAMFGVRGKEEVLLTAGILKKVHDLYRAERPRVALNCAFVCKSGVPATLTVSDGVNVVTVSGECAQPAKARITEKEEIVAKLTRMGNTPYFVNDLQVDLADGVFYPISCVNAMRRDALERLNAMRASCHRHTDFKLPQTSVVMPAKKDGALVAKFSALSQVPSVLDDVAAVVLPLEADFEAYRGKCPLLLDIPRGIVSEKVVFSRLQKARAFGIKAVLCGNAASVTLAKNAGLAPVFDFGMNLFSSRSLDVAEKLGSVANVFSFESRVQSFNNARSALPIGVYVYGRLPLMLTRNCPVSARNTCDGCGGEAALTDRRGVRFPVRCREGYSELLNSRPLWLADKLSDFQADFFILNFTVESKEECERILSAYRKKAAPPQSFTRGLYYRGVE